LLRLTFGRPLPRPAPPERPEPPRLPSPGIRERPGARPVEPPAGGRPVIRRKVRRTAWEDWWRSPPAAPRARPARPRLTL
jgi:hypothetical protein